MPAPAFVIRQIADIFTNRPEIMSGEETVEDHHQKRKEERDTVENDRNSIAGLFKGTFNGSHLARVIFDEADRLHRCAQCGHEFIPGPNCLNCGADFQGEEEALQDDWSDDDHDIDLDEVEMDYDLDGEDMDDEDMDSEEELGEYRQGFHNNNPFAAARFIHPALEANRLPHHRLQRALHNMFHGPPGVPFPGEHSSEGEEEDSDDESAGSLESFVINEEEVANGEDEINGEEDEDSDDADVLLGGRLHSNWGHRVVPISSSDGHNEDGEDDDDDAAPVQVGRRNRNRRPAVMDDDDNEDDEGAVDGWGEPSDGRRRSRPQVIDSSDDSDSETTAGNSGVSLNRAEGRRSGRPIVDDSDSDAGTNEYGDMESMGFSPMQNGAESADEESHEINGYAEYESLQDESGNDSDNTLRGEEHDEESVQWDDEVEAPSTDDEGQTRRPMAVPDPPRRRLRPWEEPNSIRRGSRNQGDVQTGSGSRPISLDSSDDNSASEDEDEEEEYAGRNQDIEMSMSPARTDQTVDTDDGESLGNAHDVHGDEDQSSEDSLPPRRRRRLRGLGNDGSEDYRHHVVELRTSPRQRMNQTRAHYEPLAGRLTAALAGRSPDPLPASRSRRRIPYAPNPPTLQQRLSRTPNTYSYNANTYARSRPQDGFY